MSHYWKHLRPRRPGSTEVGQRKPKLTAERLKGLEVVCLVAVAQYEEEERSPPPDVQRAMRYVQEMKEWRDGKK